MMSAYTSTVNKRHASFVVCCLFAATFFEMSNLIGCGRSGEAVSEMAPGKGSQNSDFDPGFTGQQATSSQLLSDFPDKLRLIDAGVKYPEGKTWYCLIDRSTKFRIVPPTPQDELTITKIGTIIHGLETLVVGELSHIDSRRHFDSIFFSMRAPWKDVVSYQSRDELLEYLNTSMGDKYDILPLVDSKKAWSMLRVRDD